MADQLELKDLKKELSDIKKSLKDINTKITNIEELEESEINHILSVKDLENRELSNLDNLKGLENSEIEKLQKITPKKFMDVSSWKKMIWNNCEDRKMNDTKKIVTFTCDLTGKACSFEYCPKNKVKVDKDGKEEQD